MCKRIKKSKFRKSMKTIEKKIQSMPYGDLIHLEEGWDFEDDGRASYIYPAYGFYSGFVKGDKLNIISSFAKTLSKACTMCRNFKYNGYVVIEDEYYDR